MPDARMHGPEKPQAIASLALIVPMSTLRCLKMRLSATRPCIWSSTVPNFAAHASMSSSSPVGRS